MCSHWVMHTGDPWGRWMLSTVGRLDSRGVRVVTCYFLKLIRKLKLSYTV